MTDDCRRRESENPPIDRLPVAAGALTPAGMRVARVRPEVSAMYLANEHKKAVIIGAVGLGALMLAQAWRRREAYDFANKSVVITGGSRGLGLVMARELADEGARLTLIARDEEELARAADDIRTRQPFADVLTIVGDVRRRYEAERAIAQAAEHHGRIDVLVNNAGIIQVGPVDHMKFGDYEDAMATHFWGPLYMIVAALPY